MFALSRLRFILPIMFALIILAGLLSPASSVLLSTISVDPQITNVSVGDTFEVKVWVGGLDAGNPMNQFRFIITWDNTMMDFKGHSVNLVSGWTSEIDGGNGYYIQGDPDTSYFTFRAYGPGTTVNTYWETFTFKCLRAGSSSLNLPGSVTDKNGLTTYQAYVEGTIDSYGVNLIEGTVNQGQQAPSNPYHYVGGELFSANKLAVLSPYLAFFTIVAVAAVVVKRKLA